MLKHPVFKFFSSLKLAVFSILSLATVLAYGTIAESLYGMRAAHVLVYGAWWFYAVLILLGTNVICAALSRYPWKKHQSGFVITHAGIITLLIGSFLTSQFGVDGNLPVQEQQQDNDVILNGLIFKVEDSASGGNQSFSFPDSAVRKQGKVYQVSLPNNQGLLVDEFLPRLVVEKKIVPQASGVGAPFLQFRLSNSRFQLEEWLTTTHPGKASEINLGPATVTFQTLWTAQDKEKFFLTKKNENTQNNNLGFLVIELNGEEYKLQVDPSSSTWKRIGNAGLQARIEKYYSYAIVEGNELINKSEDTGNPAVQLYIRDSKKRIEKHTVFANFPEFNTLHKNQLEKTGQAEIGVRLRYQFPDRKELAFVGMKRGKLMLAYTFDDKRIFFRAFGADGRVKSEGEIHPKQELPVGWMDMKLEIPEWHPNAVEINEPRYVDQLTGGESNFLSGIHVIPIIGGQPQPSQAVWIYEGSSELVKLGTTQLKLSFGKVRQKLPFFIFLEKFTIGTNPGTQKAASFESNVSVRDPAAALPTKSLISMNSPMVYGGFTFYQASYQMAEGMPAVSVFAVNYDPGRWVKYFGSLLMVLGAALMFYMNPHYWSILLGGPKKRGKA